jgi:hypothetical protein
MQEKLNLEKILKYKKGSFYEISLLLLIFVLLKVFIIYLSYLYVRFFRENQSNFLLYWNIWDGPHYQRIAQYGYNKLSDESEWKFRIFFPPFYPLIIAIFSKVLNLGYFYSAILVSNIFSFFSSYLLFYLVKYDFKSSKIAYRSVILLNVFPSAYFLTVPYSESLFLFLSLLSFFGMHLKRNVHLCFISVALAVLTRSVGIVLYPLMLFYYFKYFKFRIFHLLSLFSPILALSCYYVINFYYYGDFLFSLKNRPPGVIQLGFVPYKEAYFSILKIILEPKSLNNFFFMMTTGWSSLFLVFVSLVTVLFIKKIPFRYSIFSIINILFLSTFTWATPMPRYLLCLFPMFIALSQIKSRVLFLLYCLSSISLLIYFFGTFLSGEAAY